MRTLKKYLSKFSGILFLLFLLGIWTFISCGPEWSSQYLILVKNSCEVQERRF